MSLSARPSNFGTRFHNHLYDQLGLNYIYKAFTTNDLSAAVSGIRALGIRGCGVSMPYKTEVMAELDAIDPAAVAIGAVNTIVNTDHVLTGYNTDYLAVRDLLAEHHVPNDADVVLLGAGGMAKAVAQALRSHGFENGTVVARNPQTGPSLAAAIGFDWQPDATGLAPDVLVNATPVGMAGGPAADELPVPATQVESVRTVLDVVAVPVDTPLVVHARRAGIEVIDGGAVVALQAIAQFELYTGLRPTPDQAARAAVFAREHA
jgi:shikimate dehydrogenase